MHAQVLSRTFIIPVKKKGGDTPCNTEDEEILVARSYATADNTGGYRNSKKSHVEKEKERNVGRDCEQVEPEEGRRKRENVGANSSSPTYK